MNISSLFLTKFKYLFNKNYQKLILKSELKKKRKAIRGRLQVISFYIKLIAVINK